MLLGNSKQDITPKEPIELAGFAHRIGKASNVKTRLFLKVFNIQSEGKHFIFLIADLIWWDNLEVAKLKKELGKKFGLNSNQLLFHATHNHSGPQLSTRFSRDLGEPSSDYSLLLRQRVIKGIEESYNNLEKVKVKIQKGNSDIGIYRRKKVGERILMAPNNEVFVDNDLTVISFYTESEEVKAMWIHYSCHPTTTDENVISSEFVGYCCEKIESSFKGSNVAFLQGFSGDIRPALIKGNLFFRGSLKDMQEKGEELANDVLKVLAGERESCEIENIEFHTSNLPLTFEVDNLNGEVSEALRDEWLRLLNDKHDFELTIQYISLGDNLKLLCINAEMVQEYGITIKKADPHILPLAYSNGMLGYIPTKKQLEEGGYEAEESIYYFGYPGKLSSSMEKKIQMKIEEIIRR